MANPEATKETLSESMKELMREKPFDRISVNDICENAALSRRNFYRHFTDKFDLLQWTYDHDYLNESI